MQDCFVALDVGGTKAHLVVETVSGQRILDTTLPSQNWDAEPVNRGAAWLAGKLDAALPKNIRIAGLAIGAQGVNNSSLARELEAALAGHGYKATIVNDAALVVPAAGFESGFGIIAGTGAIGVATTSAGEHIQAGGWGCVIGDEGGASALVREAARAALRANDEGKPDDGLLGALISSFAVADAERLTRRVNDDPTSENWAPHAKSIFDAAERGSKLAAAVIDDGAAHLTALIGQLRARGAIGDDVVLAGSVIVMQQSLFDAFTRHLGVSQPDLAVHRLAKSPVEGALFLARRSLSG